MNSSSSAKTSSSRYNLYRASLLLTISLTSFLFPVLLANPVQASPASSDIGSRYHVCFTATDSPSNLTTTKCLYITVVGACTLSTADVNIDGSIGIDDLSIIALHYHENNIGPQPYNPLNTPQVGLEDLSCVALYYHQMDPLP